MSTVTIPRSNVTVEEVSAILQDKLGPFYKVTPFLAARFHRESSGHANSILVKQNWFLQTNVRVIPGTDETKIHVRSETNFTPIGRLLASTTIVPKVYGVLKHSAELAGS
jgi:hypothetical protein